MIKKIALLSFTSLSLIARPTTLILDLGGIVLARSNALYAWKLVCPMFCFKRFMIKQSPGSCRMQYLSFSKLSPFEKEDGFKYTCTTKRVELPYIICAYQMGHISAQDALVKAKQAVADHPELFKSIYHQRIIERAIEAVFSPECEAKCTMEISAGIELLKELAAIRDDGSGTIKRIVGLGNWEKNAFALTRASTPNLSHFDDIITSGETGTLKPNEKAYRYVLDKYGLQPSDCLFVDDQIENVLGARACGIESILFTDFYQLRKELHERGILPSEPSYLDTKTVALALSAVVVGGLVMAKAYLG